MLGALAAAGLVDFPRLRVLEVGCGEGANLLRFLRWGVDPARLVGTHSLSDPSEPWPAGCCPPRSS